MKYDSKYDAQRVIAASSASNDFIQYAKCSALFKGNKSEMRDYAASHLSHRLQEALLLKSAVDVGTSNDSDWAGPLNQLATAFLNSLAPFSAFDRMLADNALTRMPFRTRFVLASSGATAGQLNELAPTPLGALAFENAAQLEPVKVVSHVVFSEELARAMTASASRLIGNQLRIAVSVASDKYFTDVLAQQSGVASGSSSGMSTAQFSADLADALASVTVGANSRLYLIVPNGAFKLISLMRDTGGSLMGPGNTLASGLIRVVASDALSDSMILVDAVSIAADSESLVLDSTSEATLQLDDAPSSVGNSNTISLWTNNLLGLRATRWLGASLVRSDACALVTSVSA